MEIKTKYSIGEDVWIMLRIATDNISQESKPDCRSIQGITKRWDGKIIYHLEKYRGHFRCTYFEDECFDSEPALVMANPPSNFELNHFTL